MAGTTTSPCAPRYASGQPVSRLSEQHPWRGAWSPNASCSFNVLPGQGLGRIPRAVPGRNRHRRVFKERSLAEQLDCPARTACFQGRCSSSTRRRRAFIPPLKGVGFRLIFCNPISGATQSARALPDRSPLRVFQSACLECHDSDGRGEIVRDVLPKIPDFTDPRWRDSRGDAELIHSILNGKGKSMRPMKDALGGVDAKQMVALIRSFRGGTLVVPEEPEEPPAAASSRTIVGSPDPQGLRMTIAKPANMGCSASEFAGVCSNFHGDALV